MKVLYDIFVFGGDVESEYVYQQLCNQEKGLRSDG
jgi:hypothetical protein